MNENKIYMGFADRHQKNSPFSHFEGNIAELIGLIEANWERMKPCYRAYNKETGLCEKYGLPFGGVIAVPVPSEGFFSAMVELEEGDELIGAYEARRPGEEPRKTMRVKKAKQPGKSVEVILYHRLVLAEDEPQDANLGDWEIVSINVSPVRENDLPIDPMTLMENHFGGDGGTATGLGDSEFVEKLRVAWGYHRNKAMVSG